MVNAVVSTIGVEELDGVIDDEIVAVEAKGEAANAEVDELLVLDLELEAREEEPTSTVLDELLTTTEEDDFDEEAVTTSGVVEVDGLKVDAKVDETTLLAVDAPGHAKHAN